MVAVGNIQGHASTRLIKIALCIDEDSCKALVIILGGKLNKFSPLFFFLPVFRSGKSSLVSFALDFDNASFDSKDFEAWSKKDSSIKPLLSLRSPFNLFELFVFSDVFESNREILIEGNSVMLTLVKNYVDETKVQKKINIRKIISMKEVIDKPIDEVKFKIKNLEDIQRVNNLSTEGGKTKVFIELVTSKKILSFQLGESRKIDHKVLNLLRNEGNIEIF